MLLEHKFVKAAKHRPELLTERLSRFEKWRSKGGDSDDDEDEDDIDDMARDVFELERDWDFTPGPAEPEPLSPEGVRRVQEAIEYRDHRRRERSSDTATPIDTPQQFFSALAPYTASAAGRRRPRRR